MTVAADPDFRHVQPEQLNVLLCSDSVLQSRWDALTPLVRNEWICWFTSAKKEPTRDRRLDRLVEEVSAGKKRPCCWPGCPHRRESAAKWVKV
jgi:uncharacterized protein YdeI (YjbR/CyaY-like superfamily)